ncbi:MAG TPA: ABC transporter substrate-binding protein [Solirubrobacterales bacterium]|nr:ABC transporter substrate-binding protein [Solirubrobacterales bacterium]
MKTGWFVVIVVISLLGVSFTSPGATAERGKRRSHPGQGHTLRGGTSSFPDYLDPQLSYTTEGWSAMYDTYIPLLTYRHADGTAGAEVIPGLARSLPKITNGGTTYTLFLRKDLRYSTGRPVKASDFKFAVERMFRLNSPGSSFYTDIVGARKFQRTGLDGIAGITTNDRTGKITVHLLRPRGTFTNELGLLFVAPVPPGTPISNQTSNPPPATGPYAITTSDPGRGWDYARNPEWRRNNARLMPQLPTGRLARIDIAVVPNGTSLVQKVERGELDWSLASPPADRYGALKRKYEGTQFRVEPSLNTYFFWMNTRRPPFDNLKVRQAVNYAVDRSALQRIYAGQMAPSQQILPPGMPGYIKLNLYPHNMVEAKRLIAEAKPADRNITVWTDNERPNYEAGTYYRQVLQELGFSARVKKVSGYSYFTVIGNASKPNLDTGWFDWFEDYPHPNDFFQPMLDGESILPTYNTNFAQLDVPSLNEKIRQLDERPLGSQRENEYAVLDRSYMEQAPWVPFGNLTQSIFVSSAIDLDKVIWNPTFGADLASFKFK